MENTKHAVAATGLLVAAMRAEESARDDALFHDPFAERLAGDDGRRLLAESGCGDRAALGADRGPHQAFRRGADAGRTPTAQSQVVILAAGMDARSYRLPWHDGTTVYEVDQPQVIAIKDERLRRRATRAADVWRSASTSPTTGRKRFSRKGFNSSAPTVWTIEGLLQYIEAPDVDRLFARVDAFMFSATDTPGALVDGRGWSATVTDMAVPGNAWKRRAHPAIPADVPGAPPGYFVEAVKARGLIDAAAAPWPALPPGPPALLLISLSPGSTDSSSCFGQYAFAEIVANWAAPFSVSAGLFSCKCLIR